jgi:hypothetical protein
LIFWMAVCALGSSMAALACLSGLVYKSVSHRESGGSYGREAALLTRHVETGGDTRREHGSVDSVSGGEGEGLEMEKVQGNGEGGDKNGDKENYKGDSSSMCDVDEIGVFGRSAAAKQESDTLPQRACAQTKEEERQKQEAMPQIDGSLYVATANGLQTPEISEAPPTAICDGKGQSEEEREEERDFGLSLVDLQMDERLAGWSVPVQGDDTQSDLGGSLECQIALPVRNAEFAEGEAMSTTDVNLSMGPSPVMDNGDGGCKRGSSSPTEIEVGGAEWKGVGQRSGLGMETYLGIRYDVDNSPIVEENVNTDQGHKTDRKGRVRRKRMCLVLLIFVVVMSCSLALRLAWGRREQEEGSMAVAKQCNGAEHLCIMSYDKVCDDLSPPRVSFD